MAKDAAVDAFEDIKVKGQEVVESVRNHRTDLTDEVAAEKEAAKQEDVASQEHAEKQDNTDTDSIDEKIKEAVEDAKIPLDEK